MSAEIRIYSPLEASGLSVKDFAEAVGCRFVVVEFPNGYEAPFALSLRKKFLGEILSQDPDTVTWLKNENGKPYLENSKAHFSVSHSETYWVFAYSLTHSLGVDLEVWREWERLSRIARRMFQEEENRSWLSLPTKESQIRQMLSLWTRKEAYIKAKGSQLFREISKFNADSPSSDVDLWTQSWDGKFVLSLSVCRQ